MDFVLDASIAAAWVLEDEQDDLADEVIDSLTVKTAIAPHLWSLEVGNILLVSERRGRITAAKRRKMAEALLNLGVLEESPAQEVTLGAVMDLAAKHRLSSYDASYLELALRHALPLATLDEPLKRAAIAEGVSLVTQAE
jgi:predicted nucleic acid-binding protein